VSDASRRLAETLFVLASWLPASASATTASSKMAVTFMGQAGAAMAGA
jgi:hypothetical protein